MSSPKPRPPLHLPELYLGRLRQLDTAGLHRLLAGDQSQAAVWVRMAASAGIAAAQLRLGRMLLAGEGVERNPEQAFAWFRRAADQGDIDAVNMLGRCHENGWGVPVNPGLAFAHFRQAAAQGHDWALYNLGHCYLDGLGVGRDADQAYLCYRQAARQGHGRAMNLLARCYEEGWGVAPSRRKAGAWYRRSARSGYFRGQYNWACLLHEAGRFDEAAQWLLLAANSTVAVRERVTAILAASAHPAYLTASRALTPHPLPES